MTRLISLSILLVTLGCTKPSYDIAYVSDRNGHLDIFLTNSDSTQSKQLTNSEDIEYNLSWSKDGTSIYYTNYTPDGRQVNKLNVEQSTVSPIINDSTIQAVFDVSANDKLLLIASNEHNQKGELYLYNMETKERERITTNDVVESGAKFSANEESIVTSIQTVLPDSINQGGNAEIFEINLADKESKQLTTLGGFNALPAYSPNNKKIAFHNCSDGQCDIYIMNSGGSEILNLTNDQADNRWPRWSPDGKTIFFTRSINNSDIYAIDINGKNLRPIIKSFNRNEIAEIRPR